MSATPPPAEPNLVQIRHTRRQIFTIDGSNDVDPRNNVPFGSFVEKY